MSRVGQLAQMKLEGASICARGSHRPSNGYPTMLAGEFTRHGYQTQAIPVQGSSVQERRAFAASEQPS